MVIGEAILLMDIGGVILLMVIGEAILLMDIDGIILLINIGSYFIIGYFELFFIGYY
jgi:hypothetical protein